MPMPTAIHSMLLLPFPSGLRILRCTTCRVGTSLVTLRLWRETNGTRYEVLSASNGLEVVPADSLQIVA